MNARIGVAVCAVLVASQARAGPVLDLELAFQALHVVDTAQTLDIRKTPCRDLEQVGPDRWEWRHCYTESESAWAIGRHPSDRSVWAFMGAEAVAHAAVTWTLYRAGAPPWVEYSWQAVTIGFQAETDVRNVSIGLRYRF
jgi:hypothetical protein